MDNQVIRVLRELLCDYRARVCCLLSWRSGYCQRSGIRGDSFHRTCLEVGSKMTRTKTAIALACLLGASAAASLAQASELKTWYIYCEGKVNGQQSAIFSANIWPHEASSSYQSALAAAAESYIAGTPGTKLTGCAGIPFLDETIAVYNRKKTATMARGIGDTVYYVEMPPTVLPD